MSESRMREGAEDPFRSGPPACNTGVFSGLRARHRRSLPQWFRLFGTLVPRDPRRPARECDARNGFGCSGLSSLSRRPKLALRHWGRVVYQAVIGCISTFLDPFAPPELPGFLATMGPLTPAGSAFKRCPYPGRSPCVLSPKLPIIPSPTTCCCPDVFLGFLASGLPDHMAVAALSEPCVLGLRH